MLGQPMRAARSPEAAFTSLLAGARGKSVSVVDAKRAIDALAPLAPEERAAVVDRFLASSGARALSSAARDALIEVGAPSPEERFDVAVEQAGKVKGRITKGEIERALRLLGPAGTWSGGVVARAFLEGERAARLSPGARAAVEAYAAAGVADVFRAVFGQALKSRDKVVEALLDRIRDNAPFHATADAVRD